ncbi:hypothetical protein [Pseudoroseicyclus tamaricis]|uniref:Uncharacterized protein n=1 Tax=Pseudoroseicyclus tamaricis TaxID=2705421 RepID=A0A6B2K236_9RHOB|nr:hypothetical protein [Pseudoroseicyclus tamaricis]NDV01852.1 hypothetical protein [Pseudoroseicyclus tamaricis]
MSDAVFDDFQTRLKRIRKTHTRLAQGMTVRMDRSGLVTPQPRRRMPVFPLRMAMQLLLAALLLKAALIAGTDGATYSETLQTLRSGTTPERVGAFIMEPDPVTRVIASGFSRIL